MKKLITILSIITYCSIAPSCNGTGSCGPSDFTLATSVSAFYSIAQVEVIYGETPINIDRPIFIIGGQMDYNDNEVFVIFAGFLGKEEGNSEENTIRIQFPKVPLTGEKFDVKIDHMILDAELEFYGIKKQVEASIKGTIKEIDMAATRCSPREPHNFKYLITIECEVEGKKLKITVGS